jgi:hypothetical protein
MILNAGEEIFSGTISGIRKEGLGETADQWSSDHSS